MWDIFGCYSNGKHFWHFVDSHQDLLVHIKKFRFGGTWVAQLVKGLTLDFNPGHDLTVPGFEPHVGLSADSVEPACDSLSPALSKINKYFLKNKEKVQVFPKFNEKSLKSPTKIMI